MAGSAGIMPRMPSRFTAPLCTLALLGLSLAAQLVPAAQPPSVGPRDATEAGDRIIVKWRTLDATAPAATVAAEAKRLGSRAGAGLSALRSLGGGMHLLRLDAVRQPAELNRVLAALRSIPQVQFAEPDRRVRAHTYTPNDPLYPGQWYLQAQQIAATGINSAWDLTKGGNSPATSPVIVAVIDTGVRFEHPDLGRAAGGGKLLPGYDFISADSHGVFTTANDGDGWDPDPSDPGDFLTAADLAGLYAGKKCGGGPNQDQPTNSSWHGTRVSPHSTCACCRCGRWASVAGTTPTCSRRCTGGPASPSLRRCSPARRPPTPLLRRSST